MNIIVVGCGKVGSAIVEQLVKENHNIVVIDKDRAVLNKINENYDCLAIVGNGAVKSVLDDAGLNRADLLIACTSNDEINMLTCLIAHKNPKCKTISRIRNPEYTNEISYLRNELYLSYTINPELAAANEMVRLMRYSSTISSESFFKGQVNLLKIVVSNNSPLIGISLYEMSQKLNCNLIVCIIERGEDIIIPRGSDIIMAGDKISFVADHKGAIRFFKEAGVDYFQIKSVLIVGGGKVTYYLINNIKNQLDKVDIKVFDKDKSICEDLAVKFPGISVINGDGSDKRILLQEGIETVDAFLPLTGIDEENIVLALFAKKIGKGKLITKINRTNFIESLKELDIGSIINPENIVSSMILKQIRSLENTQGSNIERLYKLCDDKVEALEFFVSKDSQITNLKIKNLKIKKDILLACIYRNNKIIIPNGEQEIMKGDKVIVISKNQIVNDIVDILE